MIKELEDVWTDLLVAMLSVNGYSLENTYAIAEQLRLAGLSDPRNLAQWKPEEISRRLEHSAYRRGEYITC